MYKSVVFDAYGTLFDVFSVAQKCETAYPGKGGEISKIWREKQLEYSWLRTLMKQYKNFFQITEDSLRYALEALGLPYDENTIADIMGSYFDLTVFPEVFEALQKFRPRKLAILSNGNLAMLDPLVAATGLAPYLDGVLSVDAVHLFKPRPEVYQLAVDSLKTGKSETLFVSANGWDVAGAKSFGFAVGWINRYHNPPEKLGVQAEYAVSNLLDLAQKIDAASTEQ
jgi:2-haloacid dehalogenase